MRLFKAKYFQKNRKKKYATCSPFVRAFLAVVLSILLAWNLEPVYAAEATVHYGSNWYNKRNGQTFPIGLYIDSNETIGTYHIELKYDQLRMNYVSGADEVDEENGILTFDGNGNGREVKLWLQFTAISGGDTQFEVISAEAYPANDEFTAFDITNNGVVEIHIEGEDTAAAIYEQMELERQEEERLLQEQLAAQEESERLEREEAERLEAERIEAERQAALAAQNSEAGVEDGKEKHQSIFFNIFFVIFAAIVLLIILVEVVIWNLLKVRRRKKESNGNSQSRNKINKTNKGKRKFNEPENLDVDIIDFVNEEALQDDLRMSVQTLLENEQKKQELGEPVIRICDVTMEFHLSSVNPSGLKEYLIQVLKREVSYRRLFALYHVSFDVFKGEIVGIIGTNGSGKSTLLKIVSGALKPTSGHVEVDRRKIQLLTLGTGFDMELTARENVFLNGSIIGYSREFLESHYDEIVEFAELQDFMEEKVKNFSSGMVSRLGFAIATAGDAAEILILDEVLSVGDEFFRKKSLKRVKEMIHGGSTVLMVSHGMGTILDNCTKCVWIEKGELRMIGEPKVVCEEYQMMK